MAAGATVTDRCTQYALDVVAGVIIAGEYVRLACQRHLDDLEKAKAAPYKYYFDVEKSAVSYTHLTLPTTVLV